MYVQTKVHIYVNNEYLFHGSFNYLVLFQRVCIISLKSELLTDFFISTFNKSKFGDKRLTVNVNKSPQKNVPEQNIRPPIPNHRIQIGSTKGSSQPNMLRPNMFQSAGNGTQIRTRETRDNNQCKQARVVGLPIDVTIPEIIFGMNISSKVEIGEMGDMSVNILANPDVKNNYKVALITFKNGMLAAQFIEKFNKTKFRGNRLTVTEFKPKKEEGPVDPKSVHIQGLPADVSEDELAAHFSRAVGNIDIHPNGKKMAHVISKKDDRAIGKITFKSTADVAKCLKLSGSHFTGTAMTMKISPYREIEVPQLKLSKPIVAQKAPNQPTTIVRNVAYVQGLPKDVTEEQVTQQFENAGAIKRVVLYKHENGKSQGRGIISFAQPASAARCIKRFHGKIWRDIPMQITLFRSTKIRRLPHHRNDEAFNSLEPGFAYECVICFETWDSRDMMGCVPIGFTQADQEAHFSCYDCIIGHAKSLCTEGNLGEGGSGLPCATTNCKRVLLRAPVFRLLDDNSIKKLEKRLDQLALANIGGLESCKNCDFAAIMETTPRQMQFFMCQNNRCRAHFCRLCKLDFARHIGKTCDEANPERQRNRERLRFEERLTEAVVRTCPNCNLQFQKDEGCNMMHCQTCNTTQCYLCRAANITYAHFVDGRCQGRAETFDRNRLQQIQRDAANNPMTRDIAYRY